MGKELVVAPVQQGKITVRESWKARCVYDHSRKSLLTCSIGDVCVCVFIEREQIDRIFYANKQVSLRRKSLCFRVSFPSEDQKLTSRTRNLREDTWAHVLLFLSYSQSKLIEVTVIKSFVQSLPCQLKESSRISSPPVSFSVASFLNDTLGLNFILLSPRRYPS